MNLKQIIVLFGLTVALSGCLGISATVEAPPDRVTAVAAPTDAPTRAPEPTAVIVEPTATSEPAATLAPDPTATTAPEPTTAPTAEPPAAKPADDQFGVTDDGYYVRGLESAPVVIEDYSDFL